MRVKDSAKKLTPKKPLYEDMRTNKLRVDPRKTVRRDVVFYRKAKIRNKTNRVLISSASHPGRLSNQQKTDLGGHINTNFRKKKTLTLFALILALLSRRHIFKKLSSQKTSQRVLSAITDDFLGEIKLRLRVLGNRGFFFKKIQKNKKFLRISGVLKASTSKVRNNIGYRSLQVKKRRAHITKKLKKWKLI